MSAGCRFTLRLVYNRAESVSQSVSQSDSQSVSQSVSQSFSQPVSPSISQSVRQSVSNTVNQSVSASVSFGSASVREASGCLSVKLCSSFMQSSEGFSLGV
eukprot:9486284-Pyramimonas_sp.AAC.1